MLPPFDWTFSSDSAGMAEPHGGHLQVLYYGRDDSTLASQLLMLAPNKYLFATNATGSAPNGALSWVVRCKGHSDPLVEIPVQVGKATEANFEVPKKDCPAQLVQLIGTAQDVAAGSNLLIHSVDIQEVGE